MVFVRIKCFFKCIGCICENECVDVLIVGFFKKIESVGYVYIYEILGVMGYYMRFVKGCVMNDCVYVLNVFGYKWFVCDWVDVWCKFWG